jgi:GT2 family glycosyltransferase
VRQFGLLDITLIVPAYNSGATIVETLNSIQKQGESLRRISRVLLADDGSSDRTIEWARRAWQAETPLHVLRNVANRGQWQNLNEAMTIAQEASEWVLIVHSDDIVTPSWLPEFVDRIDSCEASIGSICSSWDTLYPDGSIVPGESDDTCESRTIAGEAENVRGTVFKGCWWHISGCAIRTAAFRDVGPFRADLPYAGDWEWLLRCLSKGWGIAYIPRRLLVYRRHSQTVSAHAHSRNLDISEALTIVHQYRRYLTSRDVARFHRDRVVWLARRMVREILELRLGKLPALSLSSANVLRNLVVCLRAPV